MKTDFRRLPFLRLLCAGAILVLSAGISEAQSVQQITRPIDDSQRITLKGNTHPLAQAQYDQGALDASAPAGHVLLVLKRSDTQESALKQMIADQHNPSSPSFHKWLKPGDFGKTYGVGDSDLEAVKAWLQSKGFSINKINAGKTVIDFSGTAGQVGSAFHTELHTYVRNGVTFHANSADPQIPVALAPVVKGLASLNDIKPKSFLESKGRVNFNSATHRGTPQWNIPTCASSPAPGAACTYYLPTPADIATQYSLTSVYKNGTTGAGETIGIISASNVDMSNVKNYRTYFNVGNPNNLPQTIVDGEDPGQNSAVVEAYLDLEVSGALAPAATVNLYVSADTLTTTGLFTALVRAVDDDQADVLSLSYGTCEQELGLAGNQFFYYTWQQAAAQRQSVFVSSGDSGSAGCDSADFASRAVYGLAVSGFASTPYNVAVGGTDFYYSQYASGYGSSAVSSQLAQYWGTATTDSQAASLKSPIPEQPWDDTLGLNLGYPTAYSVAAGSGGPSSCATGVDDPASGTYDSCTAGYPKPSWQTGPGTYPDGTRDLPDVSLFAADGVNLSLWPICVETEDCTTYTNAAGATYLTGVGGTSASSHPTSQSHDFELHTHRERLGAGFVVCVGGAAAPTLEAALQQAHQAGIPVADDEEDEEGRGEVVVV
jgi:subtilase family serine protease